MHWLDYLQDPKVWNVILVIGGFIAAWIQRKHPALYKDLQKYVDKIGGIDTVYGIIQYASSLEKLKTSKERQEYVADRIKTIIKERTGITIETSQANLIVEWCYTQYKNRTK